VVGNDLAVTTQPWIIAYWAHPTCSNGFHDSDTEITLREMRENALPILEDASVDLVLNGDCGSYERSVLIEGHSRSPVTFEPQTMLVDGGDESIEGNGEYQTSVIDRPIRDAVVGSSGETQVGSLDYPVIYVSLKTLGSMAPNVNGPLLGAVFLDNTGQVRNRFRMVKTTDTAKASTSASDVPTTAVNPTQNVDPSQSRAEARDVSGYNNLMNSASAATVTINVGNTWQTVVNANPAGTTYSIAAGTHRLQSVSPKTGDKFIGQTGAIMSGARLLTSFTQSGSRWYASGQTQESSQVGSCESGYPRCAYVHDLFINNVPLRHVSSLSAVVPGTFFLDYAGDRIYFGDNPAGKTVETSITATAFRGSASNVTIDALIVEKYANPAQQGAIPQDNKANWTIKNSEIRLNHGTGLRMGTGWLVENNKINTNGQMGIGGWHADGATAINNEIAYNNFAHYDAAWEGGGTKWVHSDGLLVKGNYSHDNRGPGLWTDIGNINITYDDNRVEDNFGQAGIFHEISCGAVIKNNIVKGNGKGYGTNYLSYDSSILISTSKNVEVYNNYVEVDNAHGIGMMNQNRGPEVDPKCGALVTTNNKVHDNSVYYMNNGKSGGSASFNPASVWSGGNLFNNNAYCADSLTNAHWQWGGSLRNWAGFQSQGQEANGSVYTLSNSLCTQMKSANGLPGKRPLTSDTTPPSIPTNLSATAVSSSQINLSWSASTNNVAVTGYRVESCQRASCTNFIQIATPTGQATPILASLSAPPTVTACERQTRPGISRDIQVLRARQHKRSLPLNLPTAALPEQCPAPFRPKIMTTGERKLPIMIPMP
jgi:hypothetical protein